MTIESLPSAPPPPPSATLCNRFQSIGNRCLNPFAEREKLQASSERKPSEAARDHNASFAPRAGRATPTWIDSRPHPASLFLAAGDALAKLGHFPIIVAAERERGGERGN